MFPCTQCGLCCRNLDKSSVYAELNRGDGVCVHFDEASHLCGIYEQRPLLCRVDEFYEKHLSDVMTRDDYIAANLESCEALQAQMSVPVRSMP